MSQTPENVYAITTRQGVIRETGEVVDVEVPAQRGRRRKTRRKVFALMDLESLKQLELSAQEWEVLHHLMAAVNPETNTARISATEIADQMYVHRSAVSRVFQNLRARRIIYTDRPGVHRVNAHIMFRGSNQDWDIATDTETQPVWRRSTL